MKWSLVLTMVSALTLCAADVAGTWKASVETPNGTIEDTFVFKAPTAVLSYDFWQKEYAGSASVLGKPISLDGHPFQVLGVAQPGFNGVYIGRPLEVMVPICSEAIIRGANSQLDCNFSCEFVCYACLLLLQLEYTFR
jgi:hypothetical protein